MPNNGVAALISRGARLAGMGPAAGAAPAVEEAGAGSKPGLGSRPPGFYAQARAAV